MAQSFTLRLTCAQRPGIVHAVSDDAEALALSRAVRWHCERRVLLYGNRTVVLH